MTKYILSFIIFIIGMSHPTGIKKVTVEKDCRTTISLKNEEAEFILFDNILTDVSMVVFYLQDHPEEIDSLRGRENILIPFPDSLFGQYDFMINSCKGKESEKIFFME